MGTRSHDEPGIGIRPLPPGPQDRQSHSHPNAAAELPRVHLRDALEVCIAIHQAEPDRFERAALRWLGRFCVERREASLAQVQAAAWAFDNIADEPAALETLERLCPTAGNLNVSLTTDPTDRARPCTRQVRRSAGASDPFGPPAPAPTG